MLQPNNILDALCAHMASAPVADSLVPRHEPLLQALRGFCEHIKKNIVDGSTAVPDMPLPYDDSAGNRALGSIPSEGVLYTFMRGH